MRNMTFALQLMLSLSLILTAGCQRNQSQSPNSSERSLNLAATTSPPQDVVNPAFVVTADQARKAFDEAELRGEKQQGISVGEEKSINIAAQNPLGGTETLKFSVLFLTPVEQARAAGYKFGLVAKQRTPADRKAFEDLSISKAVKGSSAVSFRVFLQQPTNEDATIPSITFQLVDKNGSHVAPITKPTSFVAPARDIIGAVGLAENGQELTFPLFADSTPRLTDKMKKMALVVSVDDAEQTLEFQLR